MGARLAKDILTPMFLIAVLAYAISLMARQGIFELPPWLNNSLADTVCLPVVLTLTRATMRLTPRFHTFVFTGWQILGIWAYFSLVFEWLLPHYSNEYVANWLDVVAYGIGGVAYWLFTPKAVE